METAVATAQAAEEVAAILAKESWGREDCLRVYELLLDMRAGASKFREFAGKFLADNPEPTGATAAKAGMVQYMLGDFPAAAKLLAAGTDNRDRRWYQGLCFRQMGQYDQAIDKFTKAGDRGWDATEVQIAVAHCQCLAGDLAAAAKTVKKLEGKTDTSDFHVLRGLLLQCQGDYDQAEEAFADALEQDPRNPAAAFRLAFLYDMKGDEEQAVELYEQCIGMPPVNAHALINLAIIYEDNGRWDEAARCLETVLAVNPNHPRAKLYQKDVLSSRTMYYDEEAERRTTLRNAVLDIPVTDFELSVRARNCLKKMNVRTLGDLLEVTEADLLGSKNFGETSLGEIKSMLQQKGLQLGQEAHKKAEPTPLVQANENALVGNEGVLATAVADLELSVRSRRALERLNVTTLGDLASRTEAELLTCKNFGQTSLSEIKQRLAEYGLELRESH